MAYGEICTCLDMNFLFLCIISHVLNSFLDQHLQHFHNYQYFQHKLCFNIVDY